MGFNSAAFAVTAAMVALAACGGGAPVSPPSLALIPSAAVQQGDTAAPTASEVGSSTSGTDSGGKAGPPGTGAPTPSGAPTSQERGSGPIAGQADESETGASWESRQVSLRPRNNIYAHDPMDHWGHRQTGVMTARLSWVGDTASGLAGFRRLLDAARAADPEWFAPDIEDGDTVAVLGQALGVTVGRWSGGPADRLSIEFNLEHATDAMRDDRTFIAMLERAGKVWSHRIDDTWSAWERRAGELKVRLIGDYGLSGREIRVGPGGETSTGLAIYVTGAEMSGNTVGRGGWFSLLPGDGWEPHTGRVALDNDYFSEEDADGARLFRTMAHEIGHVLGAWQGGDPTERYAPYTDRETGTWTGPNVVAVHGGAAPFQDRDDTHGWHDGERGADAANFDYGHSGVCASLMAYCGFSAALTPFRPAEIDFAFLADLGLTILPETERQETYGLAGWLKHAAFTVSVSRELDVSLADPQSRYSRAGNRWSDLDTIDLLWAEAHRFGDATTADLARTFPLSSTVRYTGGLLGVAVDYPGMPSVGGAAHLAVNLATLEGKASFTSLELAYGGKRYAFGDGSLHYAFSVAGNEIGYAAPGISLAAHFYGPDHDEIAGILDDSRAGLLASFGAGMDDRPARGDLLAQAGHVRGFTYRSGWDQNRDGWRRFRCGAGSDCEGRFTWWERENSWYDVSATDHSSPRERVLIWTAGWGDWKSEDLVFDDGRIGISRRYASATDGGQGRYQADGYFGAMNHVAFGTGFYSYRDWQRQDGSIWDFNINGTGVQGNISGSRPSGSATWEGRMVGYESGLSSGDDPFVQGRARLTTALDSRRIDIDFDRVTSMDRERSLADFGFHDIELDEDGTFDDFDEGMVEGAFFGPENDETAGSFHKNSNKVTGSFGAVVREPDPAEALTLAETGAVHARGTTAYVSTSVGGRFPGRFSGERSFYSFEEWGLWAKLGGQTLFKIAIRDDDSLFSPGDPVPVVEGTKTGSNPLSGSAVWTGTVRAHDVHPDSYGTPVTGDARLEVDFAADTIDVMLSNFSGGHAAMTWQDLRLANGAFDHRRGYDTISGAFYGAGHQGVAGKFTRDRLDGVFGTLRD